MVEDVAARDAEVVGVRRLQVLEVAAVRVDELEADLGDGVAAVDDELVAAVGQAQPVGALRAAASVPVPKTALPASSSCDAASDDELCSV